MSQEQSLLKDTQTELESIAERLHELADWAEEMDYLAITHKIREGVGRIEHAASAAEQYADGTLPPSAPYGRD
jgi:hypothetical protein